MFPRKAFLADSYLKGSVFFSHFSSLYRNRGCISLMLKGAVIYLCSSFSKSFSSVRSENDFENDEHKYITAPLSIRLMQPLFRYNELKWEKKTEPLRYESAKKAFLGNMEAVHMQAVQYFFS